MEHIDDFIYKCVYPLSRPQRRNFVRIVKGLIGSVRQTINRISRFFRGEITQSSLNRFIVNSKWTPLQIAVAKIIAFINDDDWYVLIVDDTIIMKFGKLLQGASYNKSHINSSFEFSRCVVSCGLKNLRTGEYFSLLDLLYISEKDSEKLNEKFKTKLEIANFFVDFCIEQGIKLRSVIFDS